MSSMLEQAIIDASALKEAALKNAEEQIIEKYSSEVKEAVSAMLEEDDIVEAEEDMPLPEEGEEDGVKLSLGAAEGLPEAAAGGEKLCPCPDDEEEVEIDLGALIDQASELDEEGVEPDSEEAVAMQLGGELQEDVDEEIELDEGEINDILEKLVVDMNVVPRGKPAAESTEIEKEVAADTILAKEQETPEEDLDEELQEAKNRNQELIEKHNSVLEKNKELINEIKKLKGLVIKSSKILEDLSLSNAKLVYKNQILDSDSLNERQKEQVVEAISKVKTVDEAKVVYETLQSGVGSQKKKAPKSLSEAVNKSTMSVIRRNKDVVKDESALKRNQKLAGII